MNASTKIDLLDHLNSRVQRHLDIAVSKFQNLDESTLLKPSSTGGWSIAQCLDHLNSYGDFYLPEIKEAIKSTQGSPQGEFRSGWLGGYFAKMMEPSAKKYKALKGHIPHSNLDAHAVIAKFISQQEDLLKYLQLAVLADLDIRVPISISNLIKLKLGDVLKFLIAHNERHIQQALRNIQ
ncbi:MAG TPA: DinB family protein [Sphingobacteriaceae bacterium]